MKHKISYLKVVAFKLAVSLCKACVSSIDIFFMKKMKVVIILMNKLKQLKVTLIDSY